MLYHGQKFTLSSTVCYLSLLYGSWEDQRRRQFNKFHNRANCSITSQSRLYRTVSSSITTQIEKLQHVARWLLCATHQCFPRGHPNPVPAHPKNYYMEVHVGGFAHVKRPQCIRSSSPLYTCSGVEQLWVS